MVQRNIIKIDEDKCNGCGKCIIACAEGAIQLVNGKAKLVSEVYCDGLGGMHRFVSPGRYYRGAAGSEGV